MRRSQFFLLAPEQLRPVIRWQKRMDDESKAKIERALRAHLGKHFTLLGVVDPDRKGVMTMILPVLPSGEVIEPDPPERNQ